MVKIDTESVIDRILRERLEQFDVPVKIRDEIRKDILGYLQRPEVKNRNSCVMSLEASVASDEARKAKLTQLPGTATPEVL